MLKLNEIRGVHIELTTRCNARCPMCMRNYRGYDYNSGYPDTELTVTDIRKILYPNFLSQLDYVNFNGNLGDFALNSQALEIVEYIVQHNVSVQINTNGSLRGPNWWKRLALPGVTIGFALDGLEDTHSLYRINTLYSTVIRNAQTFIKAQGGRATWKYIVFDHNQHQVEEARRRSEELGFDAFYLADRGRHEGWAFDKQGQLLHTLGSSEVISFDKIWPLVPFDVDASLKSHQDHKHNTVHCESKELRSIYINSIGEVYPCCYMGFSPRTYGTGRGHQVINAQIQPLLSPNNTLEHGIEKSMQWFEKIPPGWEADRFDQGRLLVCDTNCGKNL